MQGFRAQNSGYTASNRYPNVFKAVSRLCRNKDLGEMRILSFGCSTGEEVGCLADMYFPGAKIVGLDIDEDAISTAKEQHSIPNITTYALSSPESIRDYGPYDVIFAMGVLCRWPETLKQADISTTFPFEDYCYLVNCLNESLKLEGVMAINGANYHFLDAPVSELYAAVLVQAISNNGAVRRFNNKGLLQSGHSGTDTIYQKLNTQMPPVEGTFRNLRVADVDGNLIGTMTTSRN